MSSCTSAARLRRCAAVLLTSLLALGCGSATTPPDELLVQGQEALAIGEYDRAEQLALQIPEGAREWGAAKLLAGEAGTKAGRVEQALQHYVALARGGQPREAVRGRFYAGELYRHLGRLTEAVDAYRAVLAHDPQDANAHGRLAFLLSTTGQRRESLPHYFFLVQNRRATIEELITFASIDRPVEQRAFLEECFAKTPHDPLVLQGLAAHDFWESPATAEARLRSLVSQVPHLLTAQAMLGELLVTRTDGSFLEWHSRLPQDAAADPDIWYLRGLWARQNRQLPIAARCFWEALKHTPTHRRATYQLGQVLTALGEDEARDFEERANRLIELTHTLDNVLRTNAADENHLRKTAELMEQMGRLWEACAWGLIAKERFPRATWPTAILSRHGSRLDATLPAMLDTENLALRHDLSRFPDFSEALRSVPGSPGSPDGDAPGSTRSKIAFIEAPQTPPFVFISGDDPSTPGVRMFEQTGGGVAVFDYDGDRLPDLYFTQGAEWKHGASRPLLSATKTDRLFRNLAGAAFRDTTAEAAFVDCGFGQGCAVGDFDNDGFPDLYVANVGGNQLHHNNGDGTFTDVTQECGLQGEDWTTSCVIVDLNADGFPDLYDVNYLTGPGVFEAICDGHGCSPQAFEGDPDRLHLSRGDGTFEFVPPETPEVNGKGMGVIAFDMETRGRPCLFIGNDQVPNFLLINQPTTDGRNVRLEDRGFATGVAVDHEGLARASMGVAADDFDGDGRLDFHVTTFKKESRTLFLQDAQGQFVDAATAWDLQSATWPFVGWGAQPLDADRDGWPDLVVTNGDIEYRSGGDEYHMRPQFFQNTGRGRFVELQTQAGPFFGKTFLGRGLSRLDWNADGLMDFVVSNMNAPASLLTNTTSGAGRYVNVRLHAATTARDAIGAVVEVTAGTRRWTKQLIAGDGYQASNERLLQFGLGGGQADTVSLQVTWPSGAVSALEAVPVDLTLELVEGLPHGQLCRGGTAESHPVRVLPATR